MARHIDSARADKSCGDQTRHSWFASELLLDFYLGKLCAGDRLPPVRELAKQLEISPTTALDLYKKLEADGFVEGKERSGTFMKQVGLVENSTTRERTLFELLMATTRRLRLLGISPRDFASSLVRLGGAEVRSDFQFGLLCHRESYEVFTNELAARAQLKVPALHLTPRHAPRAAVREQLARNRHVRCLLTTFHYAAQAVELARDFRLRLIFVRFNSSWAAFAQPPEIGKRFLVMRDPDCAQTMRALICRSCVRTAKQTCDAPYTDPEGVIAIPSGRAQRCERAYVTHMGDESSLQLIEREAPEVSASPLIVDALKARFAPKPVTTGTVLSRQTLDDILHQYLFAPDGHDVHGPASADLYAHVKSLSAAFAPTAAFALKQSTES